MTAALRVWIAVSALWIAIAVLLSTINEITDRGPEATDCVPPRGYGSVQSCMDEVARNVWPDRVRFGARHYGCGCGQ